MEEFDGVQQMKKIDWSNCGYQEDALEALKKTIQNWRCRSFQYSTGSHYFFNLSSTSKLSPCLSLKKMESEKYV